MSIDATDFVTGQGATNIIRGKRKPTPVTAKTPKSLRWRAGGRDTAELRCYKCRMMRLSGEFADREKFFSGKEAWCTGCLKEYTDLVDRRRARSGKASKMKSKVEMRLSGELYRDRQRLYHANYYRSTRTDPEKGWREDGNRKTKWHLGKLLDRVFTGYSLDMWIASGMRDMTCRLLVPLRECAAWKEFEDEMLGGVKGAVDVVRVLPEEQYPEFSLASENCILLSKKGVVVSSPSLVEGWVDLCWGRSSLRLRDCFIELLGVEGDLIE